MDCHSKELYAKVQSFSLIIEHLKMKWNVSDSEARWIRWCQGI